jgi:hypothetical protein
VTENSTAFTELLASLQNEQLTAIDFDSLADKLSQLQRDISTHASMRQELDLLRQDYQARIAGMLKAIAAVDRKRDSFDDALHAIESLPSLNCAELTETYRRVSARFRDTFPTSFGQFNTAGSSCPRQFADYKS